MCVGHIKLRVMACAMLFALCCAPVGAQQTTPQQGARTQGEGTPSQRLEVMRSRLDAMRRSLNTAVAALNANDRGGAATTTASADDPGTRLRALENEISSVLSEVSSLRSRQDRAERYDVAELDRLEASVADLNERTQLALRATATETRTAVISGEEARPTSGGAQARNRPGFFGRLFGRGGDNRYEELTGTVAPGRDRVLFEEATREARRRQFETARLLFNVIVTAYSDSPYLPLAKLAIGDTFYLEGGTSNLIQASASYRDWLTFFPTHPLADDVMLKMAEVEMRQMGLADRDTSHARKAEQQLLVLLQQFPTTTLRPEVNRRLTEVQENLALHSLQVANFYFDRFERGLASVRGAQSRLREVIEKYPNFSYRDEALFRLGVTYVEEEEPDEAARHFQELVRNFPNSEYVERAREQLEAIGATVPQPDPARLNVAPPARPSLTSRIFTQIIGTTPVTIERDGILINKDGDGGDLIEVAIRNGGRLQNDQTPNTQGVTRTPPARRLAQPETPTTTTRPATNAPTGGVSLQPTQPGPPPGSNNTTASPQTAPSTTPTQSTPAPATTTPATTAPPSSTTPAPTPSPSPGTTRP